LARTQFAGEKATEPLEQWARLLVAGVFAAFGILYLVYSLAPETEFDGFTYHLGLPAEYWRLGAFPERIGFFEMLPQGMEMLYVPAIAIGGGAAAKLCHFGFFAATPALLLALARRLGASDLAGWTAAALYCFSPVAGVAGTAVHNDAPLVFSALATVYSLLRWRDEAGWRWAALAGLAAGFCYAIKLPGLLAPAAGVAFVAVTGWRRGGRSACWKPALAVVFPAALMIAPWMFRALILTGNPVAPLLNRFFPNPWFQAGAEVELTRNFLSYYGHFTWKGALANLVVGPWLEGIYGPWFLLIPAGLYALRQPAGRTLWTLAALATAPWWLNHGARFLMPFAAFAALALAITLPRRVAIALLTAHAVLSWPAVTRLYARDRTWLLREFPVKAVLGMEPRDSYLKRMMPEYPVVELMERTEPGARIFSGTGTPRLYSSRDALEYWHSAEAVRLFDALKAGALPGYQPLENQTCDFPAQALQGIRFRPAAPGRAEWGIQEVELWAGPEEARATPGWTLEAWPNPWEAPLALDRNRATRWRTWEPAGSASYFEVQFGLALMLSRAVLVSPQGACGVRLAVEGLDPAGQWRPLGETACAPRGWEDLRRPAIRALTRAGFRYLLLEASDEGIGLLGRAISGQEFAWGVENAGSIAGWRLFRLPKERK
jgi:hypothetical protein